MTTPASLRSDYRIVAIAMAPKHPIACTPEYPIVLVGIRSIGSGIVYCGSRILDFESVAVYRIPKSQISPGQAGDQQDGDDVGEQFWHRARTQETRPRPRNKLF